MTVLLGLFRAAMGLKRLILLLLRAAKAPFFWLYRIFLLPLLGAGYKLFRLARKHATALMEHMQDGALRILANRYSIHVAVIFLSFTVVVSNIYASDPGIESDDASRQSILETLVVSDADIEEYVEETSTDGLSINAEVSYLASQAVSIHDAISDEQYDGTDDGQLSDIEDMKDYESPLAYAVRVQPELESGTVRTRTKIEEHIVQSGESLGTISRLYGIRIETLMLVNKLSGGLIRPGQKLRILPMDGILYTVKKGDTLARIANTYKSSTLEILDINGLGDSAGLAVGMELILPGGTMPAAPKPSAPSRIAGTIKDLVVPGPATDRVGTAKMLWPTAARRITQYWRGSRHTGVDIAGPTGTAIYAANDGIVLRSEWNRGGYGNMIVMDHGGGVFTRYAHASKNLVKAGDTVKRGDVIALMGSTGRSTGPHLHFEVMTGNISRRVNPLEWVR